MSVRVVTTTCSNTEIVCALGCADLLVGVDEHSDYPEEVVRTLPRVGPDLGVDPAKVAALRPDLVIASLTVPGHERVVEGLRAAGLEVIAPEPVRLADVYADVRTIARLLGVAERGERLATDMQRAIESEAVPRAGPPPRVLVEWWPKPVIVPCGCSWVTDLLEAAGAVNPWADRDAKSTPVTDDEVRALAPDAIVVSWCGVKPAKYRHDIVYRRAGWADVPAIRARRVHSVPEAFLGRPGPRLVDGFRALRAVAAGARDA